MVPRRRILASTCVVPMLLTGACRETAGGWRKFEYNPVLGGTLGTCFDCCVMRFPQGYRMWFSWRPEKAIAWTDSRDGVNWLPPRIALEGLPASDWEQDVNRPVVVADSRQGINRMWYTGQTPQSSAIGYAESEDGMNWERRSDRPVLVPEAAWEKAAVMCPHVNWDEEEGIYKIWYSGGDQFEPNAIGYATSADGLRWRRPQSGPVFQPDASSRWEKDRVTGAQVIKRKGSYYAFYIGFRDVHTAAIGIAKSEDGIHGWKRHPANPVIRSGWSGWDRSSCYKPSAILDGNRWLLWYNGRNGDVEQIGLATHDGEDLGL